ncbi:YrhK family protein [Halomonas sabkhae]|uniref:YrhK family protein n=1 Tax=Halomonas sabkhae TaxID=626223 RepID=UPI0025B4CB12|nr:YrhK family protein [Halomonas sabkhae]MDN3524562.1 YrhK family protein [Halomonas sabkhae]
MEKPPRIDDPLTLRIGHEELVIRRRYETLSIANDFLVAIWFLAGSVLFLFPRHETLAIWLFIIGSVQFLLRPSIRLTSHLHLQRIPNSQWHQ